MINSLSSSKKLRLLNKAYTGATIGPENSLRRIFSINTFTTTRVIELESQKPLHHSHTSETFDNFSTCGGLGVAVFSVSIVDMTMNSYQVGGLVILHES